jgi:hypothetical protein
VRRIARSVATLGLVAALTSGGLAGCAFLPPTPGASTAPTKGEDVDSSAISPAVQAADPRITAVDTGGQQSGFSRVISVLVELTGSEPVSPETLAAILTAIGETKPADVREIHLTAAVAGGGRYDVFDLEPAATALLGDAVDWRISGGSTLVVFDLDAYAAQAG